MPVRPVVSFITGKFRNFEPFKLLGEKFLKLKKEQAIDLDQRTCPDQDVGEECEATCRMSYLDCRNACADHVCETLCLENFVCMFFSSFISN